MSLTSDMVHLPVLFPSGVTTTGSSILEFGVQHSADRLNIAVCSGG